jgi:hypothetical protein
VLSPEQARDARRLGVTAYSAVDAVLDDDEARAEVAVRLARRRAETPDTKTIARQRVEEAENPHRGDAPIGRSRRRRAAQRRSRTSPPRLKATAQSSYST